MVTPISLKKGSRALKSRAISNRGMSHFQAGYLPRRRVNLFKNIIRMLFRASLITGEYCAEK